MSPGVPPSFERTAPVVQRRKKRRKRELGNTGKKNKNWACGNYHKLRKANEECGAARDPPVSGGACTTELEAAEICVLEALINDYYTDLTCTVVRGADVAWTHRGDAAAATRIFRGVVATPRLRRGYSAMRIFGWDRSPDIRSRPRRGYFPRNRRPPQVPPEYIADLSDCKNSDGACRTAAAGVAAMVAAFAAL